MSIINKAAVLNPFSDLTSNILNYIPRATTSEFGIVAIGSGINVDVLGRIYLDTQEYSDRLSAIEAQAASTLATQKSEVAAAIAQVNLTQSQTITALTLEVNNLKTDLITSVTATQTELTNRIGQLTQDTTDSIDAKQTEFNNRTNQIVQEVNDSITAIQTNFNIQTDQLAQDVTEITVQLTQDKATFTQDIQDALDYLKDEASVASALRTPRKINGTDFDGRSDITTNAWGATRTFKIGNKTNSINGTSNVEYSLADIGAFPEVGGTIQGDVEVTGNLSVGATISATLEGKAASADKLHVARKIQGVDFDGTQDISLPTFTTQTDGLVPKRVGATSTKYLREDGTWVVPTNTTYALLTAANAEAGTATTANSISAKVLKDAIQYHAPTVTDITGNAGTATKLQTPRTINGISFDGTQDILLPAQQEYSLPTASASVLGGIKVGSGLVISNSVLSVGTLNQSTTGNAATATKLQTARTISLTGKITGSVSFDGSANASIATAITGLGAANGIATLDSSGQVPSTQLPSYVDDVLEYLNVAAFPTTGETGKIYVETTGNTTYRWSGTAYVKITSGEVSSVAGKVGVVTLTKADVGLANVDNTTDSSKSVASAAKLTTARTINGVSFDGTSNITVADSTKAPLDSANLIGTPTAPTAATTTNTTQLATTAFVQAVNTADTGSAATALTLKTARTINGTSFNGSANITTANWGTARTLTLGSTGKSVNGSANVSWSVDEILPTGTSGQILKHDGTSWVAGVDNNTTYSAMTAAEATTGTATTSRVITPAVLKSAITTHAPVQTTITGNAATATTLQTARTIAISGAVTGTATSFNGSANIAIATTAIDGSKISTGTIPAARIPTLNQATTANAGSATKLATARTINGVSFNGTANITVADSTKLPLAGGTLTGALKVNNTTKSTSATTGAITTTGGVGIGGALFTTGAITSANNVTAYSDIRIKDNITVIDDALNKVNQLKGVTYNRTDLDDKDKRYVGLIAQDVQTVMPEAVNVNKDEINTLSVDYQGLVGLLVESIKELKLEIDELKEKVK